MKSSHFFSRRALKLADVFDRRARPEQAFKGTNGYVFHSHVISSKKNLTSSEIFKILFAGNIFAGQILPFFQK